MSREHDVMIEQKTSVSSLSWIFLCGLLIALTVCSMPAHATDYSGTLTANLANPAKLHTGTGAAGTLSYSGTNYSTMLWTTDFDTVGIPDTLIMYSLIDAGLIGTTTFSINDTTGVYATGILECLNGSVMYGSSKQYMMFEFTSWNPGTRSGQIVGTLAIPSPTAIPKFIGTDTGFLQWFQSVQSNPTIPLGGYHGAGVWEGGKGGTIYLMNPYVVKYNYVITDNGGDGVNKISTVNITRPDNNLGSIAGTYNATTGAANYLSLHTSSTLSEEFLTAGNNYILSAYVPFTSQYFNSSVFYPATTSTTPSPSAVNISLTAYDGVTFSKISDVTLSLKNTTSGLWTNATASTGTHTFTSSDGSSAIPLAVGQTVRVAASAYGYRETSQNLTIPYSGYAETITLLPTTAINETGTFWITVKASDNANGLPVGNCYVRVISGGSEILQQTDSSGYTTFKNITSSTSFYIEAFAQVYEKQSKTLAKTSDYMNVSFSLVRKGALPYTTPATPTVTRTTVAPTPSWTSPTSGKPVSEPEGNFLDAFAQLSRSIGSFFSAGILIVMVWLFWVFVYEITGGKVIDKIIRRGRR